MTNLTEQSGQDVCQDCTHYDLVVIGAGPHSLALVSRLLERAPSSLISDDEHSRLHKLHSGKSHRSKMDSVSPLVLDTNISSKRILVIDIYGQWMEKWNRSFEAYQISHLRSPLFFHLDPAHPDGLRAFAHAQNRRCELHDITHIIDEGCKKCNHKTRKSSKKQSSKSLIRNFNQRDREQFYTPSTDLFSDFCDDLIERYKLHDMVVQGICTEVDTTPDGGFKVVYECSQDGCRKLSTIFAKAVVGAVGNTNVKNIPPFVESIPQPYPTDRIAHSHDFVDCLNSKSSGHCPSQDQINHKEIIPSALIAKLESSKPCTVVIVGGGLTSAQMVHIAIKRGFQKVILVMRSHLKVRQFDFSLDLMGRNSGAWFANFWMEKDPSRRLNMIRNERNGGSVTPEYAKLLDEYVLKGNLEIHYKSQINSCTWISRSAADSSDKDEGIWNIEITDKDSKISNYDCDQIWLATGSVFDIRREPVFSTIAKKYDIETVNGLPVLNNDLQLQPDLNFFVMSGYSALVMGPTAANLQGGRVGAERIASKLWDMWSDHSDDSPNDPESKLRPRGKWSMSDVAANMGNYFSALASLED